MIKSGTTHNHSQKTNHNHPQLSAITYATTHNHPKITHKRQKIFNTETDVDIDSDMKQWYIYMGVYV